MKLQSLYTIKEIKEDGLTVFLGTYSTKKEADKNLKNCYAYMKAINIVKDEFSDEQENILKNDLTTGTEVDCLYNISVAYRFRGVVTEVREKATKIKITECDNRKFLGKEVWLGNFQFIKENRSFISIKDNKTVVSVRSFTLLINNKNLSADIERALGLLGD